MVAICSWSQDRALIRRYFTVMLHYWFGSLFRALLVPLLVFGPVIYLLTSDIHDASRQQFVNFVPGITFFTTFFNVYSFPNTLVRDKANGMKSLMISMGLSRFHYYRAHSICFLTLVLPVTLVIAIISYVYVFVQQVNIFAILLLFILFSLHLDAFLATCVSFFTSTSYTFIISLLVFMESLLHILAIYIVENYAAWKTATPFLVSFSPYENIRQFCDEFLSGLPQPPEPMRYENKLLGQRYFLIFLSQIFWILFFRLFAYWFEEICPWQTNSGRKHPCFCFTSGKKSDQGDVEGYTDGPGVIAKYFEASPKQIGDIGIKVNHVTKSFSNVPAVSDVSFSIYKGETTLLLGHNGAGKSTLMNMILGQTEPNTGSVKIVARSQIQTSVGVCPQTSVLDDDLTVKQHLELFNDIKSSVSGHERASHIRQTIDDVSLTGHESKRPAALSGGMKRKLSLAIAFVGKSEVLILDEPSSGLDPDSRMFIWNAIRRYRSDRTVLLSTQHMEEADYLGDRIAIMSSGRIVCCGSSLFLNKLFGNGYKLRIECKLSTRKRIIDHIRNSYFDAAHPSGESMDAPRDVHTDPIINIVLELNKSNTKADSELDLIRLLEDLENNSESLGVRSHGLKSSSIEDVMLNTGKYFAHEARENEQVIMTSAGSHIATVTDKKVIRLPTNWNILRAMIKKHVQVNYANLFFVLMLRLVLPIAGCYAVVSKVNGRGSDRELSSNNGYYLFIMISHLIYFPVRERASKFKTMQLVTKANVWLYWSAQAIVDLAGLMICVIFVNVFVSIFVKGTVASSWDLHGLLTLATILFYLSGMVFCYCFSTVLNTASSSIGHMFIIVLLSTILNIIVTIFRLAVLKMQGAWMSTGVTYLGALLIPTDAYALFLGGLSKDCYVSDQGTDSCRVEPGLSDVAFGLFCFFLQIVAYLLLLVMIESQALNIEWYCNWRNICACIMGTPRPIGIAREIDQDVADETSKAQSAINNPNSGHALVTDHLNKSYVRSTKVIDDLSFTVDKGECFGLLGVNGAGKTTFFSMMAAESCPDSGQIVAHGNHLDRDLHRYREMFGYDPQATPEISLTPYQALYLMAQLRGVSEYAIPTMIASILELLEMNSHMHKLDTKLSGGTKRKLALGMSLIGNPNILALDEPTAGVDPVARRGVWQLLKSLRAHNEASIIISSHAMEECEAICDRISIMARGRLRCIGTFLHLRSKFAKGCTLRIQFSQTLQEVSKSKSNKSQSNGQAVSNGKSQVISQASLSEPTSSRALVRRRSSTASLYATDHLVEELQQLLNSSIGPSVFKMSDRNVNSVTFDVTDNRVRRSILFRLMRDFKQKHQSINYMINDSSLEEIFISLAREEQERARQPNPQTQAQHVAI